jgi:lysine/ornithine N-monooxygenase
MSTTMAHDVAVVGAGPYGLACAAHLRARGLDVRVLGQPMDLWERCMPTGMFLRSSWEASAIADPDGALSLDAYEAAHAVRISRPIPLADYLRYARWFQRSAVPDVDTRRVERVEPVDNGLEAQLEDGDALAARRVVIATGPAGFARRPAAFDGLSAPLVRHSSELRELDGYAGRRTAVVGAGQSAIELAALLHEAGADVEVIARAGRVRWLRRSGWLHGRDGALRRMLYPPTDVGPVGLSWLVAVPDAFRHVPEPLAGRIAHRCIRPAASSWLVERTAGVAMSLGRSVASATAGGEGMRLELDDGGCREVDRVVLATGFQLRADRHPLLGPELRSRLQTRDGMPVLGPGFVSSVPGLHFVGAFAAGSFGPVMRFVSGTPFTGRALAAHLGDGRRRPSPRREPASASASAPA